MSFFATYDGSSYQLTTAGFTALVIIMIAILLIGCAILRWKEEIQCKAACIFGYGNCPCHGNFHD